MEKHGKQESKMINIPLGMNTPPSLSQNSYPVKRAVVAYGHNAIAVPRGQQKVLGLMVQPQLTTDIGIYVCATEGIST